MIRRDRRRGNGGGDWDAAIKSLGETLIKVLFGRWPQDGIMKLCAARVRRSNATRIGEAKKMARRGLILEIHTTSTGIQLMPVKVFKPAQ